MKGIAEQLDATSRLPWENRMVLDMMLAEKGGVCVMLEVNVALSPLITLVRMEL